MKINEIKAKSVLVKCGLPSDDYVINPYSGCAFGCAYCYADFTRRFQGHLNEKWGEYVDVKINTPELLEKELALLIKRIETGKEKFKNGKHSVIWMSSVTDPYQGVESKYKLTRECIQIMINQKFPGELAILTKSPLVTRDIDLFKQLKMVSVGLTITSTNDSVSRLVEKHAPTASARIRALKKLNEEGINTYVCINPLLPHFADNEETINELFRMIKDSGTNEIFVEHLNLSWNKRKRLSEELSGRIEPEIIEKFWFSQNDNYKKKLEDVVYSAMDKYGLKILAGGIIDHQKLKTSKN